MIYIGFWRRFLAVVVDSIILGLITNILWWVILDKFINLQTFYGLIVLIGVLYSVWFESSTYQATPGKMAIGAKVVGYNGQRISFGLAFLRYVGKIISTLIIFIGYFMVAFTAKKQGLHDYLAKTLVIKA